MSDLRKAAEAVLEAWGWDWSEPRNEALKERMEALRQALAQPEWVGLPNDEEILEISKDAWGRSKLKYGKDDHRPFYIAFARAIEAKLKEKNT